MDHRLGGLHIVVKVHCAIAVEVQVNVQDEWDSTFIVTGGSSHHCNGFLAHLKSGQPSLWEVRVPSELMMMENLVTSSL